MRLLLALSVVGAAPAWADDTQQTTTFHQNQFGLSARFGLGVRGIATYDNDVYCGATDPNGSFMQFASVCTGRTPISLDLEAAYGVARSIEVTLELRLGIERDFGGAPGLDGPRPLELSPGARFFFSEAAHAKLFVQPMLRIDLADYQTYTGASRPKDVGFRGMEGFWLDLHRTYGLYFFVSESAEFVRWLEAEFALGVGFQGRYP